MSLAARRKEYTLDGAKAHAKGKQSRLDDDREVEAHLNLCRQVPGAVPSPVTYLSEVTWSVRITSSPLLSYTINSVLAIISILSSPSPLIHVITRPSETLLSFLTNNERRVPAWKPDRRSNSFQGTFLAEPYYLSLWPTFDPMVVQGTWRSIYLAHPKL